jgi:hypothetical protein
MVNIYWIGNTGSWTNPSNWSDSSGGTPRTSEPNFANSNLIFDENSFSADGQTTTVEGSPNCGSLNMSLINHNINFVNNGSINLLGDITIPSSVTISGGVFLFDSPTSGVANIDIQTPFTGFATAMLAVGTLNLLSNLEITTNYLFINSPNIIFNTDDYNLSVTYINNVGTFNGGTSTLTLTGIGFQNSGTANLSGTTIIINNITPDYTYLSGLGTVNNIEIQNTGGTTVRFVNSTVINTDLTLFPGTSVRFDSNVTIDISGTFNANGTPDENITLAIWNVGDWFINAENINLSYINVNSSTAGGTAAPFTDISGTDNGGNTNWIFSEALQFYLVKTSGIVSCDYLDISNSNAGGGASWYAGLNSNDTTNNTGWIFRNPETISSAPLPTHFNP